jgi:hypothetical protein
VEPAQLSKFTPDPEAERALSLNDRVGRITQSLASLAKLSWGGGTDGGVSKLELSEEAVNDVIRAWRERAFYLPEELFFDPAWGMLLELLHAEVMRKPTRVSELCKLSRCSMASAARWLSVLENRELVCRRADPHNPRSDFVELSPKASAALRQYFHDVLRR